MTVWVGLDVAVRIRGVEKPGNVPVEFLLCMVILECKVITVAVHLVTTVTQDCLENTDYTNMDTAYDPGVVHVHETFLDAPNSHDEHEGFIS